MVTGTLSVRFMPDAPTDRLVFRFWANAPRLGRAGSRFEVVAAFLGEQQIAGTYEAAGAAPGSPGTLYFLPGSFPAGQPVEARIDFRLFMPGAINDRVAQIGRSLRLGSVLPVLSWVRGSGWQTSPAVDAFAEAAASEVADWDVTVTAPPGFTTLATGTESSPGRFVAEAVRDWARHGGAHAGGGGARPGRAYHGGGGGGRGSRRATRPRWPGGPPTPWTASRPGSANTPIPGSASASPPTSPAASSSPPTSTSAPGCPTSTWSTRWLTSGSTAWPATTSTPIPSSTRGSPPTRLAGRGPDGLPAGPGRPRRRADPPGRVDGRTGTARAGPTYLSVYVGGLQALAAYGDAIGGYDALDCALRRYHRDRAFTVSRPADLFDALARQTGVDPRPVLARFGLS